MAFILRPRRIDVNRGVPRRLLDQPPWEGIKIRTHHYSRPCFIFNWSILLVSKRFCRISKTTAGASRFVYTMLAAKRAWLILLENIDHTKLPLGLVSKLTHWCLVDTQKIIFYSCLCCAIIKKWTETVVLTFVSLFCLGGGRLSGFGSILVVGLLAERIIISRPC